MGRQTLNMSVSQQLQLTPKLQQAIHMLQLSSQELSQEIQTFIESNIMLEPEEQLMDIDVPESQLTSADIEQITDDQDIIHANESEYEFNSEVVLEDTFIPEPTHQNGDDHSQSIIDWYNRPSESLRDYLQWQLEVSYSSDQEKIIGEAIIDSINEDGFLEAQLDEIQETLKNDGHWFEINDIETVLKRIQSFDPIGVGSRDLKEALLLQISAMPNDTPGLYIAKLVVEQYLTVLATHNLAKLKRLCKTNKDQLNQAIHLIHKLNPRPGNSIAKDTSMDNIIPDVLVIKKDKNWVVSLNNQALPKLHINNYYINLLEQSSNTANNQFIQGHLQEARWLMKCLHNRNETLLKVASYIVKYQKNFMEYGPGAMKPLVLRDIADELGMHQSTVSRITSRKYIQTPQGTFELKYFFSSHVNTNYGQKCSAMAIRTHIQNMLKQENHNKPLSDEAITKNLLAQGIQVARRTVTKYRESLGIAPANKRKQLCKMS